MKKAGEHIRVNFGQDAFSFDIDGMMAVSGPSSSKISQLQVFGRFWYISKLEKTHTMQSSWTASDIDSMAWSSSELIRRKMVRITSSVKDRAVVDLLFACGQNVSILLILSRNRARGNQSSSRF